MPSNKIAGRPENQGNNKSKTGWVKYSLHHGQRHRSLYTAQRGRLLWSIVKAFFFLSSPFFLFVFSFPMRSMRYSEKLKRLRSQVAERRRDEHNREREKERGYSYSYSYPYPYSYPHPSNNLLYVQYIRVLYKYTYFTNRVFHAPQTPFLPFLAGRFL